MSVSYSIFFDDHQLATRTVEGISDVPVVGDLVETVDASGATTRYRIVLRRVTLSTAGDIVELGAEPVA
jgi:hypothetical protein